ncbi:hypothetical protein NZK33_12605 [Cyanobium sp. FGCU-6]|nr:hypothetical protein [Cyanobium sp. FGCU6]
MKSTTVAIAKPLSKLSLVIPAVSAVLLAAGSALASGNTAYGVPTPPGPFVVPVPSKILPEPWRVPGKEFSTYPDLNSANNQAIGQSMFWDGLGGVQDAKVYSNIFQLDALAYSSDALFHAVLERRTNLLLSFVGDSGGNSVYAINPYGNISIWATNHTVWSGPPASFDLDALEIWGPELVVANRFSLQGDVSPDGTQPASVMNDNGTVKYTPLDIATAIGAPQLADDIDLDGLMVFGDELLFSIQPIGGFDGGEIWHWTGGAAPAEFLKFGKNLLTSDPDDLITWNTGFNIQDYFAHQGYTINSENIDAIEAASTVPGPLPLLGVGTAFGLSRKLRRRIEGARLLTKG